MISGTPTPDEIAQRIEKASCEDLEKFLRELAGFCGAETATEEHPKIVLGSRSPRRSLILGELLDIKHKCLSIDADEVVPSGSYSSEVVSKCFSAQKFITYMQNVEKVRSAGNILIVGDTIVVGKDGKVLGKEPENLRNDDERYEYCCNVIMDYLGGRTVVYSSIIVTDFRTRKAFIGCDSVAIHFRGPDLEARRLVEEYCAYVYDGDKVRNHRGPIGKAGSFGVQESEILSLVEKVEGDVTVAVGLPANLLIGMLSELPGLDLPMEYNQKRCVDVVFSEELVLEEARLHALALVCGQ